MKNIANTDPAKNEIQNLATSNFLRWKQALLTKDAAKVSELYTEDATFLPTVSCDFKKGKSGAACYFEHFLEKNPTGDVVNGEVQAIAADCYVHSGMYNFEVGPPNNRKVLEARFTFIWGLDKHDEWKILHHHSSLKPTI